MYKLPKKFVLSKQQKSCSKSSKIWSYKHLRVVTIYHFIEFIDTLLEQGELYKKIFEFKNENTMLISSQKSNFDSGSETIELFSNIKKVHECMVQ